MEALAVITSAVNLPFIRSEGGESTDNGENKETVGNGEQKVGEIQRIAEPASCPYVEVRHTDRYALS